MIIVYILLGLTTYGVATLLIHQAYTYRRDGYMTLDRCFISYALALSNLIFGSLIFYGLVTQ